MYDILDHVTSSCRLVAVSSRPFQHYEHKLKEMDVEVHRHEQEHERLLADLEKLEKQTEVAVQVRTGRVHLQ